MCQYCDDCELSHVASGGGEVQRDEVLMLCRVYCIKLDIPSSASEPCAMLVSRFGGCTWCAQYKVA